MRAVRSRLFFVLAGIVAVVGLLTLAVGDYFGNKAMVLEPPLAGTAHPALAAVYWSGDMGMRAGVGRGVVDALLARGIPVLTVSSPVLFGQRRDQAFADRAAELALREALRLTGAQRLAIVGNSYGADIVGATTGHLPDDLRRRIGSVVMIVPGERVYFHANPFGLYYRGPGDSDPARAIALLRGLPVTCISAASEKESLCRTPALQGAHRVELAGGHLLLGSRNRLEAEIVNAVLHPPGGLQ